MRSGTAAAAAPAAAVAVGAVASTSTVVAEAVLVLAIHCYQSVAALISVERQARRASSLGRGAVPRATVRSTSAGSVG